MTRAKGKYYVTPGLTKNLALRDLNTWEMVTISSVLSFICVIIILEFQLPSSLSQEEQLGDLTIHCGIDKFSIVNITYFGDINEMFIEDKSEECFSEQVSPAHHVIFNINGRDCGYKEVDDTGVWTVLVRLQMGFLVTANDRLISLGCSYDSINNGVFNISVQNDAGEIYVPSNTVNTENSLIEPHHIKEAVFDILSNILHKKPNVTMTVLDENRNTVQAVYPDSKVYLRLGFHSLLVSEYRAPVIRGCNVTDKKDSTTFNRQIVTNGCGDDEVISRFQSFHEVDNGNVSNSAITESNIIYIPQNWTDALKSLFFTCDVMICEKQLPCQQTCPFVKSYISTDSDKMFSINVQSELLHVRTAWIPTTSLIDTTDSPQVTDLGLEDSKWNYIPYIFITAALVILLIIFGVILLCVIREQVLANRMKDLDIIERLSTMTRSRSLMSINRLSKGDFGKGGDSGIGSYTRDLSSSGVSHTTPQTSTPQMTSQMTPHSLNHGTPRRVSFCERINEFPAGPSQEPIRQQLTQGSLPAQPNQFIPLMEQPDMPQYHLHYPTSQTLEIMPPYIQQYGPFQSDPFQYDPFQSDPFQSAPFQSAPFQSAPFQAAPAQYVPFQAAPVQSVPFQSAPVQPAPFQSAPFQVAPFQVAPFQVAPFQVAPFQVAPFQPSPFQTAPVQPSPFQTAAVQPSPFQTAAVQPSPFQTAAVQPFPFQTAPVPPAPIQSAPFHLNIGQLDPTPQSLSRYLPRRILSQTNMPTPLPCNVIPSERFVVDDPMYFAVPEDRRDFGSVRIVNDNLQRARMPTTRRISPTPAPTPEFIQWLEPARPQYYLHDHETQTAEDTSSQAIPHVQKFGPFHLDISRIGDLNTTQGTLRRNPRRRNSSSQTQIPRNTLQSERFTVEGSDDPLYFAVPVTSRDFGGVGISKDNMEVTRRHGPSTSAPEIIPLLPPIAKAPPIHKSSYLQRAPPLASASIRTSVHDLSDPFPQVPLSRLEFRDFQNSTVQDNVRERNYQSYVSPYPTLRPSASNLIASTQF